MKRSAQVEAIEIARDVAKVAPTSMACVAARINNLLQPIEDALDRMADEPDAVEAVKQIAQIAAALQGKAVP